MTCRNDDRTLAFLGQARRLHPNVDATSQMPCEVRQATRQITSGERYTSATLAPAIARNTALTTRTELLIDRRLVGIVLRSGKILDEFQGQGGVITDVPGRLTDAEARTLFDETIGRNL